MKSIVFTFGRMNPPTRGHERLVSTVVETARAIGGDHIVYLSQTQRAPTDPLAWSFKRRVCEAAFPGVNLSKDLSIRNPFIALDVLKEEYDDITMVVGSDQVEEFEKRFTPYANHWGVDFTVISAGERIAESRGIAGLSATKMREWAAEGKKEKFLEGLPKAINSNVKELVYNNTRRGLRETKKK